jgi:hypothetical protein
LLSAHIAKIADANPLFINHHCLRSGSKGSESEHQACWESQNIPAHP